jgi:hypothetical protein
MAMAMNDMYLAVPSYNPDPRIRLPIPGEHVINDHGERVFEKHIIKKQEETTLEVLYELGLYDNTTTVRPQSNFMESSAEVTTLKY